MLVRQYAGGANGNRSLERGIEVLRAFRPGVDTLGNGEIAERTGLPRSTVSRLTKTLVDFGMLDEVRTERTYRLAAAVLSLGHAVRMGSPVLKVLGPLMRAEFDAAQAERRSRNGGSYDDGLPGIHSLQPAPDAAQHRGRSAGADGIDLARARLSRGHP